MILVTREFTKYLAYGGSYQKTEFKFFADDDIKGIQDYVDTHNGTLSFKKL